MIAGRTAVNVRLSLRGHAAALCCTRPIDPLESGGKQHLCLPNRFPVVVSYFCVKWIGIDRPCKTQMMPNIPLLQQRGMMSQIVKRFVFVTKV